MRTFEGQPEATSARSGVVLGGAHLGEEATPLFVNSFNSLYTNSHLNYFLILNQSSCQFRGNHICARPRLFPSPAACTPDI